MFKELLECVQYLHESNPPIIHRDLKPANILIAYNNRNGRYLKICDFGLATVHINNDISHTEGPGTMKYMAPEVSQSNHYSINAHIYSLRVIAQELFDFHIYE